MWSFRGQGLGLALSCYVTPVMSLQAWRQTALAPTITAFQTGFLGPLAAYAYTPQLYFPILFLVYVLMPVCLCWLILGQSDHLLSSSKVDSPDGYQAIGSRLIDWNPADGVRKQWEQIGGRERGCGSTNVHTLCYIGQDLMGKVKVSGAETVFL